MSTGGDGWRVEIAPAARRDLKRLDRQIQARILDALPALIAEPPTGDIKRLTGIQRPSGGCGSATSIRRERGRSTSLAALAGSGRRDDAAHSGAAGAPPARGYGRARARTTMRRKELRMQWSLEVVVLPVSDIDRSVAFYRDAVGFHLDHDTRNEHMHVVQLTPPGSGCSIVIGDLPSQNRMAPGSMKGLQLVVPDARAARQELLDRGVEASELNVITEMDGGTFFGFSDPDGNTWAVQEIRARAQAPLLPEGDRGLGGWAGR
jgi:catechol 2,3-dioxygenase-like lactoylglutathione lyase family enzyme